MTKDVAVEYLAEELAHLDGYEGGTWPRSKYLPRAEILLGTFEVSKRYIEREDRPIGKRALVEFFNGVKDEATYEGKGWWTSMAQHEYKSGKWSHDFNEDIGDIKIVETV